MRMLERRQGRAFGFALFATAGGGAELEPTKAMAISPIAKIDPTIAFRLIQRLNVRWSSADMVL